MRRGRASSSAQLVALARAHLTWLGVVDDPYAAEMLRAPFALAELALRVPVLRRLGRNRAFTYLAARTVFYDAEVQRAVDDGMTQVVALGAGYDSRAWRFARAGVRFFEVDHPATQRDKRSRAPQRGPTYVPADLTADPLEGVLLDAGFVAHAPAMFTVEGVTMYLSEREVVALLSCLAGLASPGSRLAVNFGVGGKAASAPNGAPRRRRTAASVAGEPFKFQGSPADAGAFLASAGWTADEVLTGPALVSRHLTSDVLPTDRISPHAYAVTAVKRR